MNFKHLFLISVFFTSFQCYAQEKNLELAINRMVAKINSKHDESGEVKLAIVGFKKPDGREVEDFSSYLVRDLSLKLQQTKRFKVLNQNMVNAVYNSSGIDVWKSVNSGTYTQFTKEANLNIHVDKLIYGLIEDMNDSLAINLIMITEKSELDSFRVVFFTDEVSKRLLKKSNSGSVDIAEKKSETNTYVKTPKVQTVVNLELEGNQAKENTLLESLPEAFVFQTIGELKVGVYAAERMGSELHVEVIVCKIGEIIELPYVKAWFSNQKDKLFYKQFNTLTFRKFNDDKCINANIQFVDNTKKVKHINTLFFELEGIGSLEFKNLEVF